MDHYHTARCRPDARRDRLLGRLGWRVLRLPTAFVEAHVGSAVQLIVQALAYQKPWPARSNSGPRRLGRREASYAAAIASMNASDVTELQFARLADDSILPSATSRRSWPHPCRQASPLGRTSQGRDFYHA
jgi:hypothetical protein